MTKFSVKWRLSDLPSPSANAPTVFSCFSCGGGSSMGYKRAGFRVIGNLEEDIRAFAVRETYPDALYDLDVLDGSPPCTTFSVAGLREKVWGKTKKFAEGQAEQRLDDLFFEFIAVKICWDNEVAPTLLNSGCRHIRAYDKSFLSNQDLISCSTFPSDYLNYSDSHIQFLTGMCVPPNLAAHIATEIRNQWLRH